MKKRSVRAYAMDCLARREMSFNELLNRLIRAEYPYDEALLAVENLRDDNLQSDTRFVEAYVASRVRRGHGPNRIRFDIRTKSVSEKLVDQALQAYADQWEEVVFSVLQKRYHTIPIDDYTMQAKAYQFCLRKGHDAHLIRSVLKQWLEASSSIQKV